ncbi:hypothetical protein H0H93_010452 [Arthromyces matolae]|nr:hypothetical protein H0H93_010452 [Arthromyces matolae]
MLPRDKVRKIMLENDPEGFNHRYPGHQKKNTLRTTLTSIGPFREISADGHEKLGKLALKMGDVGLSIYAYKDKWTANLLKITVVPDCRSVGAIGHLYLDFCEEYGGIPAQLNLDKGSEIGWQFSIQEALRDLFAPDVDSDVVPPCVLLKSVHNIIIEALWKWLKEKEGMNMKDHILRGKHENIFNSNIEHHRDLFNWIFPPLVQAELDEFKTWWNNHKIRSQKEKAMLSGHVPGDALLHPKLYGGLDCLISVSKEALTELRECLTHEEGSRDSHLRWVSEEFEATATTLYDHIGRPKITWDSSWKVFASMSEAYEELAMTDA